MKKCENEMANFWNFVMEDPEYQGRKVRIFNET